MQVGATCKETKIPAATIQNFSQTQNIFFCYCVVISFVLSWHLSRRALQLSSPVIPLSQCESERVSGRHRKTEKGKTWEGTKGKTERKQMWYGSSCVSKVLIVDPSLETQTCNRLKQHRPRSLIAIPSGHLDHKPTASRLPEMAPPLSHPAEKQICSPEKEKDKNPSKRKQRKQIDTTRKPKAD